MHAPRIRRDLAVFAPLALFLALFASAPALGFGGPPPAPDSLGPWAVGHTSFEIVDPSRDDRPLPIQAWYPADPEDAVGNATYYLLVAPFIFLASPVAIEDIPVLDRFWMPLIVFSHGSGSLNIQSTELMETLASHGFVVVAPNHTGNTINDPPPDPTVAVNRPLDVSFLIDHMLARSADPADPFHYRIRPFGIGVVGHSFGGYTALAMPAGLEGQVPPDPRVRAIVPTSAVTGIHTDEELASIEIPTMLIGGTLDTAVPIDPDTIRAFELISSRHLYRADIVGATHSHFANVCAIADVLIGLGFPPDRWAELDAEALLPYYIEACSPGVFPVEESQRIQALYTVAFFRRHLYLDLRYQRFLTEGYAEAHEPDVIYFDGNRWECGDGVEMALILPALIWFGRRTRRPALR
jgi:predicted dienelactone hydrolase